MLFDYEENEELLKADLQKYAALLGILIPIPASSEDYFDYSIYTTLLTSKQSENLKPEKEQNLERDFKEPNRVEKAIGQ